MEYERSLGTGPVVEHRSTRTGRWLRARRVRIALWIAAIEGLLVVVHAISWWAAITIAALVIVGWFGLANRLRSDAGRQAAWIAAASQSLVVLVPILVKIVGALALIAVGLLAAVALVLLFSSRD